jgi:hypothetical protein
MRDGDTSTAIPQETYGGARGRVITAPTHSRPRH